MNSVIVEVDCDRIANWDNFHDVFAEAFGFPAFYGRNMDAWIDCMSYLDSPSDQMTTVHAPTTGGVVLQLNNVKSLAHRCPEIYDAIIECSAFVNWRRLEARQTAMLILSFYL